MPGLGDPTNARQQFGVQGSGKEAHQSVNSEGVLKFVQASARGQGLGYAVAQEYQING